MIARIKALINLGLTVTSPKPKITKKSKGCCERLHNMFGFEVPRAKKQAGDRAFSVAGPHLWNGLPSSVRTVDHMDRFKNKLKSHLFSWFFLAPWAHCKRRYINHIIIIIIIIIMPIVQSLYNSSTENLFRWGSAPWFGGSFVKGLWCKFLRGCTQFCLLPSSRVASPICQEGQSERTFPIFAFSSRLSSFSPIFPDFSLIFGKFFAVRGGTLPSLDPPVATPVLPSFPHFILSKYGCTKIYPALRMDMTWLSPCL